MARIVDIHPSNPQARRVAEVVAAIRNGGLIAYPTDSSYALGCHIGNKQAMDRIRAIRRADKTHNFTLVCSDLSEISLYARVDNWAYRMIRSLTPGPYTFILQATREVPKRLQNPKRRTIGLRVPDHAIVRAILETLGEPIMSSTLSLPGDDMPLTDADDIQERIGQKVDLIVTGGPVGIEPTSVIDLSAGSVEVLRKGRGDVSALA
ncbi:MAG: L-threonylcarbamoyladenylate synthase [Woeseiaceae bacterium]|nr:L-threonylcarbamoyladenylate synthase [Woeseiaceae bacterium]